MHKPVILCVDDEQIILDTLSNQLRLFYGTSIRIEIASTVEEAWEIIQELHEDGMDLRLIISDWLMPPHRGDQFLHEVHANWPHLKLIMLSGQADENAIERINKLSSLLAFVRKPWDKEEIIELTRPLFETEPA